MNPKLSNLIIGVVVMGMVIGVVALFMSRLDSLNHNAEYSRDDYTMFQKLDEINNISNEVDNTTTTITQPQSTTDILNGYFGGAYNALIQGKKSMDVVNSMGDDISNANKIQIPKFLLMGLGTILTIIVIVGIIMSSITKREE